MGWLEMERLAQDDEVVERCAKAGRRTLENGKWPMTRAKLAEFVRVLRERERSYGSDAGWAAVRIDRTPLPYWRNRETQNDA